MFSFWLRLQTYWRRRQLARDFRDEIAFHLETRRDRLIAQGMTPEQATLAARRAFGSTLRTTESLGEVWAFRWLDDLVRDLAFAVRTFRRNPVFALAAVLSLALGIGSATAIYAAAYSMLWRPMPVQSPDRLVALYQTGPNGLDDFHYFSYPELLDYRRQVSELTDLAGSTGVPLRVTGSNRPELVWGQVVTDNFFSALQIDMAAGRGFRPDEESVAVLSYRFWQRRFNQDPHIVGKQIAINSHVLTIVGVTGRGFTCTQMFNYVPDVSIPVRLQRIVLPGQGDWIEDRANRWITLRARLKPHVTMRQAETALNVVAQRLARQYPETNRGLRVHVLPGGTRTHAYLVATGAIGIISTVVFGSVILLLVIACTNVANLMLARSASRSREMATRIAVGAGRARLVRQLLAEGLLLALAGGAAGLVVARLLGSYLWSFYPTLDFLTADVEYDSAVGARMYLFALAVSMATALVFSLGPALRASKTDQASAIRGARPKMAPLLVAAQVALSLVLLVTGGLFVRSLQYAQTVNPGFDRQGLLIFMIDLDLQGYGKGRGLALERDLVQRLQALPGVRAAAVASPMPLGPEDDSFRFRINGYAPRPNEVMISGMTSVGAGYFPAVGTQRVAGRDLRDSDNESSQRVAVINETFARRFWRTPAKALGQRVGVGDRQEWVEVVGVVRDGKYGTFGEAPMCYTFFPMAQEYRGRASIVLRTDRPLEAMLPVVRREARALDPELPILGMKTIEQYLERLLSIYQMGAFLLGLFAGCALLLSSVGLFGLLHFNVAGRTREIGIRMALGAGGRNVAASVLLGAFRLVGTGLLVGLAGALAVKGLVSEVVAGVSAVDPATYVVAVSLILVVGAAATLLPALRAAAVDPVRALHWD